MRCVRGRETAVVYLHSRDWFYPTFFAAGCPLFGWCGSVFCLVPANSQRRTRVGHYLKALSVQCSSSSSLVQVLAWCVQIFLLGTETLNCTISTLNTKIPSCECDTNSKVAHESMAGSSGRYHPLNRIVRYRHHSRCKMCAALCVTPGVGWVGPWAMWYD